MFGAGKNKTFAIKYFFLTDKMHFDNTVIKHKYKSSYSKYRLYIQCKIAILKGKMVGRINECEHYTARF